MNGKTPGEIIWWELADALFLASVMERRRSGERTVKDDANPVAAPLPNLPPGETSPVTSVSLPESQFERVSEGVAEQELHLRVAGYEGVTSTRRPLSNVSAMVRALRRLKRVVPSSRDDDVVFDAETTAERAVYDGLWWPITKPDMRQWLDLTVVVDGSPSVAMWRSRIAAFIAVLERLGAFRSVQVRQLDTRRNPPVLRGGTPDTPARSAAEVLDRSGRRIVLVITDGVDGCWRHELVGPMLAQWGRVMPVAVVNLLPERLWRRSGLTVERARVHGAKAMEPNRRWRTQLLDAWLAPQSMVGPGTSVVPVPVIELDPEWLGWWARLVTGGHEAAVDAWVLLASDRRSFVSNHAGDESLTVEEQVSLFRSAAAPQTLRLATLLAAVPVTVPVARVLQAELAPETGLEHLAEVFISGLLHPDPVADDSLGWDKVTFDFPGPARELLLAGARRSETARAIRVTAAHFGDRINAVCRLRDALEDPNRTPDPELPAEIALDRVVMRALSGPYAARAERLSKRVPLERTDVEQPDLASELTVPLAHTEKVLVVPERLGGGSGGRPIRGNIPPRNPHFTGRTSYLGELSKQLTASVAAAIIPAQSDVVNATGKTQLAVEYIYRRLHEYDLVWWVQAAQVGQIRTGLTELAQYIGLQGSREAHSAVPAVLRELQSGRPFRRWLLVFDSAEDPDVVRPFFPANGTGEILVTSRNPRWTEFARTLELPVFGRRESVELLQRRGQGIGDADADRLAGRLMDLPIAIAQAAAWRVETRGSVDDYLRLFDEKLAEIRQTATLADHDLTVAATWGVSLDALREHNLAAHQLLEVCAFFAPEPIHRHFFTGVRGVSITPQLDQALGDPMQLAGAIRDIHRYGLAKIDHRSNTLRLHSLVQDILRSGMTSSYLPWVRHGAHVFLANVDPNDPASPRHWPRYLEVLPHVIPSDLIDCDDNWVRQMVVNIGTFLYYWGDHETAVLLLADALDKWSARLGEADEQSLQAASRLGISLWALGRFADAAETNDRTLAIRRRVSGENADETILAELRVAVDHKVSGKFTKARVMNEHIFRKAKAVFGEDEPITLQTAHDLAVTLRLCGEYQLALQLDQDTYTRRAEVLGYDNAGTLNTWSGLSLDHQLLGDYSRAREEHEQVAARVREILGDDQADMLRRNGYLAVAKRKDGAYTEALALSATTLQLSQQRYGNDHVNTLEAAIAHSIDLRYARDLDAAYELGERTFACYQNKLGEHHPHTLSAGVDLGVTLRTRGDAEGARRLTAYVLEQLITTLGRDHPNSIICGIELASDLSELGETEAAARLGADVVARSERVLGSRHPTTLAAKLNLAHDQRTISSSSEMESVLSRMVELLRWVLGADHPAVHQAEQGLRADCDIDQLPF